MEPLLDLTKEYGIVLDGGGARGAYQIGAWKALKEAGVKINAVAGTSVGALNGALICMDDIENAEKIWSEMTFSKVMDVDDRWMEELFAGKRKIGDVISEVWSTLSEGGVDITPLRRLIHEMVDEEKIRSSGKEFCLLTFSLTDMKELDLSIEDIPEGMLEDFLLASAYLLGFKNEKLHGKRYIDGGVVNNVPLHSLVKRGYTDIIEIRIYGPGRVPRVKMPKDSEVYEIGPRVRLGSIIEFDGRRSRQNLKIGYYDAKRMLYGLEGFIYYLEQNHEEIWYNKKMSSISDREKAEMAFVLKLPIGFTDKELYLAMLEASAKLLRVPKYQIYTVDTLGEIVKERYEALADKVNLPRFTHVFIDIGEDKKMNLKGRNFLTLKDFTPEEITYLLDLAADVKEKKKNGIPVDHYKGKNIALIFTVLDLSLIVSFLFGKYVHIYARPVALAALLVFVLVGRRDAIFMNMICAILMFVVDNFSDGTAAANNVYSSFIIAFSAGMIAIFFGNKAKTRFQIVGIGLIIVIPVDFIRKVLYKKAVKSRERILGKRLTKGKKYSIIKKNLGEERI